MIRVGPVCTDENHTSTATATRRTSAIPTFRRMVIVNECSGDLTPTGESLCGLGTLGLPFGRHVVLETLRLDCTTPLAGVLSLSIFSPRPVQAIPVVFRIHWIRADSVCRALRTIHSRNLVSGQSLAPLPMDLGVESGD